MLMSDKEGPKGKHKSRPALNPEARENQLIALAVDVAEQKLRNGTASSQLITHFLKLGSTKERYEIEKLKQENKLLEAKTDAIKMAERSDELYAKAVEAMRIYQGAVSPKDNEDFDE